MEERPVGRPTVMTPEIIDKLKEAFLMGCSDLEACLLADIGKTTLYEYQKQNPNFTERKELLKNNLTLQSRKNIHASITTGDTTNSKWYLERKKRDEFSTSADINLGGQYGENPVDVSLKLEFVTPKE